MGEPARALEILRSSIPRAGELAAALRLEAGQAAMALGRDPFPFLAHLLSPSGPSAPRQAAAACLRTAWETLPLPALGRVPRTGVPRALRRDLSALLAVRAGDEGGAFHIVNERVGDQAALRAAQWLTGAEGLSAAGALAVAEALLAGGAWREADALLVAQESPSDAALRWRWAFLRGRAAYRLGDLGRAASAFDEALAAASSDGERFEAAVQRARSTQIAGDPGGAIPFWDIARTAAPHEVEGWDGGTRARVAADRGDEAVALLQQCPAAVTRVAGPRLAATLLARGDLARARGVLTRLPDRLPVVRVLWVGLLAATGDSERARTRAAEVLADPRAGPWREMVLDLLPGRSPPPHDLPVPTRDLAQLARTAASYGVASARTALAAALVADPEWARLLAGAPFEPADWAGPAQRLVAVGLDHEAATLFPNAFPRRTPEEVAWTATRLAAWGNPPAALTAGELLWGRIGSIPAVLLPEPLLRRVLAAPLVAGCKRAAHEADIPVSWLVGIVRQESRFDAEAYSSAGAVGVAQLVPEAALRLGALPADLRDPDIALRLAACEVTRLCGRVGRRLPAVAAAYNAGESVVASWLSELGGTPADPLFAASIPYRETAGYVLAVREGAELASCLEDGILNDRQGDDGCAAAPGTPRPTSR
ncbi:MAG: transglycosylase SLT domain-containing protein [Thermoanaerobaculaceae bacterium]